jgi:hypothetical protein
VLWGGQTVGAIARWETGTIPCAVKGSFTSACATRFTPLAQPRQPTSRAGPHSRRLADGVDSIRAAILALVGTAR